MHLRNIALLQKDILIFDCIEFNRGLRFIDAANLKSSQRQLFAGLSRSLNVRFLILSYTASVETLRNRVEKRALNGSDVSDATAAILERQLKTCEPLFPLEQMSALEINTDIPVNINSVVRYIEGNGNKK